MLNQFFTGHFFQPPISQWSSWWKVLLCYTKSVQAAIDGAEVRKSISGAFTVHLFVTKYRRWRNRERARARIEPTAAAPSQPDCPGVSRSDHSAGSKESASWRALELRSDWHGRLGVGRREKEGKETSWRGSQDEPAQDKEENGSWTNSAKR